jgi:hypothetical protein
MAVCSKVTTLATLAVAVTPAVLKAVLSLLDVALSVGIVKTPDAPLPLVPAAIVLKVCRNWAMAVGPASVGSVAPDTRFTGVTVVVPSVDGCKAGVVPSVTPAAEKVRVSPAA